MDAKDVVFRGRAVVVMAEPGLKLPLKTGLLIAAIVWFLFSFHELFKAAVNVNEYQFMPPGPASSWVLATDILGVIGLVFRTAAGVTAIAAIVVSLTRRGLSAVKTVNVLRWILIAEAIYWLSLLLSGIWAFLPIEWAGFDFGEGAATGITFNVPFIVETGIPVLVESIALPIVLVKLFSKLSPNKPPKDAVKWGLITGTVFLFVFWLNNTCNWIYAIMQKGAAYVTTYPDHILSFGLTTIGLLALALYATYFSKKSIGTESVHELNLRKIGGIITAIGMYFLVIYVMWLMIGTDMQYSQALGQMVDAKWSDWYAWFLGHNMDLWALSLPLVGLPLLFHRKRSEESADIGAD